MKRKNNERRNNFMFCAQALTIAISIILMLAFFIPDAARVTFYVWTVLMLVLAIAAINERRKRGYTKTDYLDYFEQDSIEVIFTNLFVASYGDGTPFDDRHEEIEYFEPDDIELIGYDELINSIRSQNATLHESVKGFAFTPDPKELAKWVIGRRCVERQCCNHMLIYSPMPLKSWYKMLKHRHCPSGYDCDCKLQLIPPPSKPAEPPGYTKIAK